MHFSTSVSKRKLLAHAVRIPTMLFIAFLATNLLLMSSGERKYENLFRILSQWDGQHYLSIARDGYTTYPCPENPNLICGNAGWFPLYPLIGASISKTGLDVRWAMLAVSWLSLWLALILLYRLLAQIYDTIIAALSCLFLLLFPSAFYLLTMFPYSLYLLLAVSVLTCLYHKSYRWLWIPCGLLAVTYPSGIVIGLPVLYELIRNYQKLQNKERVQLFAALAAIPLALVLYCTYNQVMFNDFFLYSRVQSTNYAHTPAFPLVTIFHSLQTLSFIDPELIAILVSFGIVILFFSKRLPVSWWIWLLGIMLFTPSLGTTQCYYRHLVVALPLAILVALAWQSKRKWVVPLYAIIAIWLYATIYLPQFKLGTLM